jgi:ABC-2 type transport system permease protein
MGTAIAIFRHLVAARLAYGGALLFSAVLHPLVMLVTSWMLKGIYAHHGHQLLLGYTLPQLIWYFGAAQFFYQLVWNTVEKNVGERVMLGRLDRDLVRPFPLLGWELLEVSSQKLLCFAFEFVPVIAVYTLICHPEFMTFGGFARYLLLTAFGFLQFFALSFVLASLTLVWRDSSSLSALKLLAVNLLSGVALPIAFFPRAVQDVILRLPFHYLFHTPVEHLLGRADATSSRAFIVLLGEECLWSCLLLLLAWLTQRQMLSRLTSAGG